MSPTRAPSDGRVVKPAVDDAQATRIRAEAEVLAAGRMPGVVELIGVEGASERPELVTGRVHGPDLDRAGQLSIEEVAGVVAAVATTLADLHDLGLVHGAVMAAHVLVGTNGRPVLCGFGYGGHAGEPPVAEAPMPAGHGDPARRAGDPLAPSADVYALGAMLRALLPSPSAASPTAGRLGAATAPGTGSLVARRRRIGRARTAGNGVGRRRVSDRLAIDALATVADRATTAEPALRIGARAFAEAVGVAVPNARLPRRMEPEEADNPDAPPDAPNPAAVPAAPTLEGLRLGALGAPSAPPGPRRTRAVIAAAVGGVAAVVVVVALVGLRPAPSPEPASRPEPGPRVPAMVTTTLPAAGDGATASRTETAGAPAAPEPAPSAADPRCPVISEPLAADIDGDGCPEALRWVEGAVVAGDRRWTVGRPGDRVATADWSCSGRATLALLRPATGDVFVFSGWAQAGHDLVAVAAGRVEGGFAIRAADAGDGCPRVAVERGAGAPVILPVPARSGR